MRRLGICAAFLIPALLFFATTPGCGKKEEAKKTPAAKKDAEAKKDDGATGEKKPIEAGDAVIKGKVVYDGTPPKGIAIAAMQTHKDHAWCEMGSESEKINQTWLVDDKKGVANVVVWLNPPAGKYFSVKAEDKKPPEFKAIDQPHCAFVPHVIALYPSYFSGKDLVKTGQKLKIKNTSKVEHNTKWTGDEIDVISKNFIIPKGEFKVQEFNYEKVPPPLEINCNIHTWMNGWILFFDNPYHAVTDAKGNFEIKNVPVGVDLTVVGWHEGKSPKEFYHKEMPFKKGDNSLEIKITK
jgi:hypothetical protein